MKLSLKNLIVGAGIGVILLFSFLLSLSDGKLHIFFCDVGQGDAAYIRAPNNQDILIDGGPNDSVLSCLGRHMPFYDRTIDVVMLTHPQKDHLQGLLSVIQRYKVKNFIIGIEGNDTQGYRSLIDLLQARQIKIKNLYTGDKFSLGKVEFDVLWPEKKWVKQHTLNLAMKTPRVVALSERSESNGTPPMVKGSEGAVLGLTADTDLNYFSYYLYMKYGSFTSLFTGDGDVRIQDEIMKEVSLPRVNILKYPHHGSKYGAGEDFLKQVYPDLTVISVGKNPWGHPNTETLDLLGKLSVPFKRTDQSGDVEIVSDGKGWVVNTEKN